MRILIDARFLGTGTGIACYTENLIKNLAKIDKKNHYLILLEKKYFNQFEFPASNFKKIKITAPYYSLTEQIKLPILLWRLKPDFVHFTSFNHPLIYRRKCIFTIHDLILTLFPPKVNFFKHLVYRVIIRSVVKKAKKIIVPSQNTKQDIQRFLKVKGNKIVVIFEGVNPPINKVVADKNYLKNKHKISKIYLLYMGRFAFHKNISGLIDAFNILKNKYKNGYQLVLVGNKDKDYFSLKQRVKKLRLENDIIFTGTIKNKEMPGIYRNAEVFILPSFYEGFGLPVLEAMSHGTPVVCSRTSSLPEVAGDAAYYFNPKDPKDMAKKINDVLVNKGLRENLIKEGLKQYKKFSWLKTARKTLLLYKSLVK
jgi:glycosyltransferase involved in cell wall biosynthesis